jgi:hypothetical protein
MNNTPAFPIMPPCDMEGASAQGYPYPDAGMTLRDYFAAKAMQGFIANGALSADSDVLIREVCSDAYAVADAMLKVREA